jgi:hypothetical protein
MAGPVRAKLRNIERDPRVVLSFDAPREPGVFLNPYAVLRARAAAAPSDGAWDLLVERIGGVGPWVH